MIFLAENEKRDKNICNGESVEKSASNDPFDQICRMEEPIVTDDGRKIRIKMVERKGKKEKEFVKQRGERSNNVERKSNEISRRNSSRWQANPM